MGIGATNDEFEMFTERVLAVLAQRTAPVRCRELAAELGLDAAMARNVERVRHRLKKLCQAGRVVENTPGMFVIAQTAGATH